MRRVRFVPFVAVVAALAMPAPSHAQLVLTGHACDYMMALTAFNPDAAECLGAFAGNNDGYGEADVLAAIVAAGWGTPTQVAGGQWSGDQSQGILSFNPALNGDYVLALKAANSFSLYRFLDLVDVSQIYYTTQGVSVNRNDKAQGLSHYALYSTGTVSVPEPESAALLLTGVLALGFVGARRRRNEAA